MNAKDYLQRLKAGLRGLPDEEQADLVEEIAGHIAAFEDDPNPEGSAGTRGLALEMGSPDDLSRGLRNIHHPRLWIDFLLVVVPAALVFPGVNVILNLLFPQVSEVTFASPYLFIGIRISIALHVLLVAACLLRRSEFLLAYWLPETILTIFVLCFREKRWNLSSGFFNVTAGGVLESLVWLALMIGLAAWLVSLLWRHPDPLLVTLAFLPFLVTAGNMTTGALISIGGFPGGYNLPDWALFGYLGPHQAAHLLWPALFYLRRERLERWLGLLVYALPLSLMNLVASTSYPALAILWSAPIWLVVGGWIVETIQSSNRATVARP